MKSQLPRKPTARGPRRAAATVAGAVALALLGGALVTTAPVHAHAPMNGSGPVTQQLGPASFSDIVERVKPAVVAIATTGKAGAPKGQRQPRFEMPDLPEGTPFSEFFRDFFEGPMAPPGHGDSERRLQAQGSGFIIDPDGYVVTNHHVVEHAEEISVILDDGTELEASVQGRDPKTDLALLKVESDEPLPHVELGDSNNARIGDWVVAVGNPFGLGGTVTAGIISARGRDIQSGPYDDYIQVDAPINRGNSGGPLFDASGKVIGVNTAIFSPSGGNVGIGFAIPSEMAGPILAELKSNGRIARGWLGVQIQPVTEEVAESLGLKEAGGALVANVEPGSPADDAGLRPGDVIVGMDDKRLESFKALPRLVGATQAGSKARLEVYRDGKLRDIEVGIGSMPDEQQVAAADPEDAAKPARLGVRLTTLDDEARQRFGLSKDAEGVLVVDVERGSPAARAGIRPGQLISMVGQSAVETPQQIAERVEQAAAEERASLLLLVEDRDQKRFIVVKLRSA
jgi:serine protease Do